MIENFKKIDFFSATTDIWSRSNRSFIAISVHFYDENLELKTAFIACESFEGNHNKERVAQKLRSIFERYGILEKVFFITTDGAGEYVAALKFYGDNNRTMLALTDQNHVDWLNRGTTVAGASVIATTSAAVNIEPTANSSIGTDQIDADSDSDSESEDSELDFVRMETTPDEDDDNLDNFITYDFVDDDDTEPLLGRMNRIACSSHRLEKIGRFDALDATNDLVYKEIHDRVFKVLAGIWDQKESRLAAETFFNITGCKLIGPHRIRWMKTYDAVSDIKNFHFSVFLLLWIVF